MIPGDVERYLDSDIPKFPELKSFRKSDLNHLCEHFPRDIIELLRAKAALQRGDLKSTLELLLELAAKSSGIHVDDLAKILNSKTADGRSTIREKL